MEQEETKAQAQPEPPQESPPPVFFTMKTQETKANRDNKPIFHVAKESIALSKKQSESSATTQAGTEE